MNNHKKNGTREKKNEVYNLMKDQKRREKRPGSRKKIDEQAKKRDI